MRGRPRDGVVRRKGCGFTGVDAREDGAMMGGGVMGAMGLWMALWVLLGLAVLVLAVLGIIWLVHRTGDSANGAAARGTADELLRRRYATGEIDEEEYRRRRDGLS